MKLLIAFLLLCSSAGAVDKYTFEGPWKTTNRRLDGIQTATIYSPDKEQWVGKFYGTWQGVSYSYDVKFTGPPNKLKGVATIDGAHYDWTGTIDTEKLVGKFGGDRYVGSFNMKRKIAKPKLERLPNRPNSPLPPIGP